jgi:hypothetical protein
VLISFRPSLQLLHKAFSSIESMFVRLDLRALLHLLTSHSVNGKDVVAPLIWVGSLYE